MKRPFALACASVALCAFGPASGNGDARVVSASLAAGKVHEECLRVDAGGQRRYHWKSDAPVDFNIHYHKEPEVFYPVKRDAMRGDGGTFRAKTAEDYCWMWTARDKPAKVEGRIEAK